MPCFPAWMQSSWKSCVRPGTWFSPAKRLHSHTEMWQINQKASHVLDELKTCVLHLNETEQPTEYYVNKVDKEELFIQIYVFTPVGWLDIVEIKFCDAANNTCQAMVNSFSTGLLPAWVPCGLICDMLLCFIPFSDGGANETHCGMVREALPFTVTRCDTSEECKLLPGKSKLS